MSLDKLITAPTTNLIPLYTPKIDGKPAFTDEYRLKILEYIFKTDRLGEAFKLGILEDVLQEIIDITKEFYPDAKFLGVYALEVDHPATDDEGSPNRIIGVYTAFEINGKVFLGPYANTSGNGVNTSKNEDVPINIKNYFTQELIIKGALDELARLYPDKDVVQLIYYPSTKSSLFEGEFPSLAGEQVRTLGKGYFSNSASHLPAYYYPEDPEKAALFEGLKSTKLIDKRNRIVSASGVEAVSEYLASDAALIDAANAVLGDHIKTPLSADTIQQSNASLASAIHAKYPDDPNQLTTFLHELASDTNGTNTGKAALLEKLNDLRVENSPTQVHAVFKHIASNPLFLEKANTLLEDHTSSPLSAENTETSVGSFASAITAKYADSSDTLIAFLAEFEREALIAKINAEDPSIAPTDLVRTVHAVTTEESLIEELRHDEKFWTWLNALTETMLVLDIKHDLKLPRDDPRRAIQQEAEAKAAIALYNRATVVAKTKEVLEQFLAKTAD
jgi:hypothetical protein